MAVYNPDTALAKLGSNLTFLKGWSTDNEQTFVEVMDCLREEKPEKWADIFLRVQDKLDHAEEVKTSKSKSNTNININMDFSKLQALAGTVDPNHRIEESKSATTYAPFEEVK